MGFYNRRGISFEIIVRDETNAKLDTFRTNTKNFPRILNILKKKYGVMNINNNKDLDWVKKF